LAATTSALMDWAIIGFPSINGRSPQPHAATNVIHQPNGAGNPPL